MLVVDEYQRAILESQAELELTSRRVPPVVFSEQEQRLALHALGLDESGAVEYALMVSHEEAAQQGLVDTEESASAPQSPTGTSTSLNTDFTTSTTPSGEASASTREDVHNMPSSPWKSKSLSRLSPPNPNAIGKIQLSPPYRAEAMSVGNQISAGSAKSGSESDQEEMFPRISPPSTTKGSSGTSTPLVSGPSTPAPQLKKATQPALSTKWSAIVKSSTPSPSPSGSASPIGRAVTSSRGSYSSRAAGVSRDGGRRIQAEDAQLQFALELSLAEAMSRRD